MVPIARSRQSVTRVAIPILLIALAIPTVAHAECGPRPTVGELVNGYPEIFVGRVLATKDKDYPLVYRMHVVRSYKGAARGDVRGISWRND